MGIYTKPNDTKIFTRGLFFTSSSISMELAEVYNIRYYGPEDNLRGIIMVLGIGNGGKFLFNDMGHLSTDNPREVLWNYECPVEYRKADKQLDASNMPLIKSGDLLKLTGPAQSSIDFFFNFKLKFYCFGVFHEKLSFHTSEDTPNVPLEKLVYGDGPIKRNGCKKRKGRRRKFVIRYALFDNAVEACVKIKFISIFDFSGTICAGTSAITDPDYTSILFSKGCDEKLRFKQPEEEMVLQLSRHFVAVPLGSHLILRFALHVDVHEVVKTVTFFAKEELTSSTQEVVYGKGVIQVEVSWRLEVKEKNTSPRYDKGSTIVNNGYFE